MIGEPLGKRYEIVSEVAECLRASEDAQPPRARSWSATSSIQSHAGRPSIRTAGSDNSHPPISICSSQSNHVGSALRSPERCRESRRPCADYEHVAMSKMLPY